MTIKHMTVKLLWTKRLSTKWQSALQLLATWLLAKWLPINDCWLNDFRPTNYQSDNQPNHCQQMAFGQTTVTLLTVGQMTVDQMTHTPPCLFLPLQKKNSSNEWLDFDSSPFFNWAAMNGKKRRHHGAKILVERVRSRCFNMTLTLSTSLNNSSIKTWPNTLTN